MNYEEFKKKMELLGFYGLESDSGMTWINDALNFETSDMDLLIDNNYIATETDKYSTMYENAKILKKYFEIGKSGVSAYDR